MTNKNQEINKKFIDITKSIYLECQHCGGVLSQVGVPTALMKACRRGRVNEYGKELTKCTECGEYDMVNYHFRLERG